MGQRAAASGRRRTWRWRYLMDLAYSVLLLAPVLGVLLVVVGYPLVRGVYFSFHEATPFTEVPRFVGFDNFARLLGDPTFHTAVVNTLVFNTASVVGGLFIGFAYALLLNRDSRVVRLTRAIAIMPWIVPYVVVGYLFLFMFNGRMGIINYALQQVGLIQDFLPWFSRGQLAMTAVITANIWQQYPFFLLMLLAGLQSVPAEVVDAARVDGAGSLAVFRYVTLPHLTGIILISTTLMIINNFNNFPIIWTMTSGGPVNATTTLVVLVFRTAFNDFNFGYAAAIATIWLASLLAFSQIYIRAMRGEVAA